MAACNIKSIHGNIASVLADRRSTALKLKEERVTYAENNIPGYKEISLKIREKGLLLGKLAFRGRNTDEYKNAQTELESMIAEKEKLTESLGKGFFDDVYTCGICSDSGFYTDDNGKSVRCRCYKQLLADMLSVLSKALEGYDAMRQTEGAAMEADLRNRAKTILSYVEQVEQRSPVTLSEYRQRLENKMREVLENTNIDESRILTEAAIYADKIAVDEETVRLRSHFAQLDALLTTGGPIGRKLDFLLQEMNRETNTIGSKGNDIQQARTVVEIKSELEKIREQTQNIE